jgi:hypothetical protein
MQPSTAPQPHPLTPLAATHAVFIFALVGMSLFGGAWTAAGGPDLPRFTYNNFPEALLTAFATVKGA